MSIVACPVCGTDFEAERSSGAHGKAMVVAKYCSAKCRGSAQRHRQRMKDAEMMAQARKLALAGKLAPLARRVGGRARITLVDKESKPVRNITVQEYAERLAKRHELEFSTGQPTKKERPCKICKAVFKARTVHAERCDLCRYGRCVDCHVPLKARPPAGGSGRCRDCRTKAERAARAVCNPVSLACAGCGQLRESRDPVRLKKLCRSCMARKRYEAMTEEQRKASVRKLTSRKATLTPEQKAARNQAIKRSWASLSEAERDARVQRLRALNEARYGVK